MLMKSRARRGPQLYPPILPQDAAAAGLDRRSAKNKVPDAGKGAGD